VTIRNIREANFLACFTWKSTDLYTVYTVRLLQTLHHEKCLALNSQEN